MRQQAVQDGLTVRAVAGTYSILLGFDLTDDLRSKCLGFSIKRVDVDPPGDPPARWLPSMLSFPSASAPPSGTCELNPIQKFRWGDYTASPGRLYRYEVHARGGDPQSISDKTDLAVATVEVRTEDPSNHDTPVFFNRAAAASNAYEAKFGNTDPTTSASARAWLSRGLEEAILSFLDQATDSTWALHAAIYEFQYPELLAGLKAAIDRGADVQVAYHARAKNASDSTKTENAAAAQAAGLTAVCHPREAGPQSAIMHDKFVVLLRKDAGGNLQPQAVWTGSTNWTDGGLFGQLNVGHAVYDAGIAAKYEQLFQLLYADVTGAKLKTALAAIAPPPASIPTAECILPIFSPQSAEDMLVLYGSICKQAKSLFVSAPFELAPQIRDVLEDTETDTLRFVLADKTGALGSAQEVSVIQRVPGNEISVAVTLNSPLHNYQNKVLEGKESFHHAGIHIHSKIILADPFSDLPILVTGSANFSHNSTEVNDSNSLLIAGHLPVVDIYVTEFMRMFEHYHFRAKMQAPGAAAQPLGLVPNASWTDQYYVAGSPEEADRKLFS